jgi:hypothetical protein
MALTRIDDPLAMLANGSAQVCGPLRWDADETGADFGFILRQGNVLLVGRSSAAPPDAMWMGTNLQRTGGRFQPGLATGTVVAVIRRSQGRSPVSASWVQEVELRPAAT